MSQQTTSKLPEGELPSEGQTPLDSVTGSDEFITDDSFSYAGYQITREEFFSHAREPSLSVCGNRLYANKICLRKAPDTQRVLIMVNSQQKKIILKPCSEERKDSVLWVTVRGNVRHILCKPAFCAMISSLTGWDLNNRYKMLGKLIRSNGERLFLFDLNSALIYPRKAAMGPDGNIVQGEINRDPVYLESWRHQFGLPVEEHERTYAINRFEDYVVISVQGKTAQSRMRPQLDREERL